MASTRKPRSSDLSAEAAGVLAPLALGGRALCVGLSGGVDSVVLLKLLLSLRRRFKFNVSAMHVNHGLSSNASEWETFCSVLCRRWKVPLSIERVRVRNSGSGIEAAARVQRYRAFSTSNADALLLAHHLDDQAETVLLQLLRGAGVKGIAAMPAVAKRPPHTLLRPLLGVPRAKILAYAKRHRLDWIEDESNEETALKRNFLRHIVLPVIEQAFPAYRKTLARSGAHCAEAAVLLDDIGATDLGIAGSSDANPSSAGLSIDCSKLRRLSPARAINAMRVFFSRNGLTAPDTERAREMLRQLLHARRDAQVRFSHDGAELRRFRDSAWIVRPRKAASIPPLFWAGETSLELPGENGTLDFRRRGRGVGLSLARLQSAKVTVKIRAGGERIRPDVLRPRRSLKNLLQESALPPWERERLPLLFCGNVLAWVPEIGADASFLAKPGEPTLFVSWRPLHYS